MENAGRKSEKRERMKSGGLLPQLPPCRVTVVGRVTCPRAMSPMNSPFPEPNAPVFLNLVLLSTLWPVSGDSGSLG